MLSGPATRPETPLAVENSVGKLAAAEMWRQMPARERELGELPSPIWSLLDRKVGQGLDVFRADISERKRERSTVKSQRSEE